MSDVISCFFSSTKTPRQPKLDWLTKRHHVPNLALGGDHGMSGYVIGSANVEFDRHLFDFVEDGDGAAAAIVIVARDLTGMPIDLVAWAPKTDMVATLYGRAVLLGEQNVFGPKLNGPLAIHRSVLGWLRAGRRGAVVLDRRRAWRVLDGIPVIAEDVEHGLGLRKVLTAPSPSIMVTAVERERTAA